MKQTPGTALPSRPQLFFVEEPGIKGAQRSKQSRAHVARVNRQRQKLKSAASAGAQTTAGSSSNSSSEANTPATGVLSRNGPNATKHPKRRSDKHMASRSSSDESIHANDATRSTALVRRNEFAAPISQTVAPVFGGLAIDAFGAGQSTEAADMATYLFITDGCIMDSWLEPALKPSWFAAFFQHPLVYYALSFSCGVIQDVHLNRPVGQKRILQHIKTIQLVNKQLDNLDNVDLEPLILAIMTLWRVNFDTVLVKKEIPLLFSPHRRSSTWVLVAGKLGGDGSHAAALQHLIQRKGGLGNFKSLPSLQWTLGLADVLDSCANAHRPKFDTIWNPRLDLQLLGPALLPLATDIEGTSFAKAASGRLPANALRTYEQIAALDKLLDYFADRSVSRVEEYSISQLGTGSVHELLSIVPWDKLAHAERESYPQASYEACRIASMIYSFSVIFPMKSSDAWLEKLLNQLRRVLETSIMDFWTADDLPLLVWSLFIGGMAAFWTSHRTFFIDHLRMTLQTMASTSWSGVKSLLEGFLWRDSACSHGAAILWDVMQFDEADS